MVYVSLAQFDIYGVIQVVLSLLVTVYGAHGKVFKISATNTLLLLLSSPFTATT